ncbi:hypothetical protein VA596_50090 [Amycolatopsis sp., V23-08]|uniref:CsbD family protein n=1 Tax=Amycolatopsis heterodermiae TaxID=3110235 RepID=A0ABU5RN98_9PSEU|nr:hypothetical protein [Amycolatopsis sp., V23-08]MEA5367763.1 hypothetical protein [Amycolatopsis sp., V23-08]
MSIRDSFRRANETVADARADVEQGRAAAQRAALDRAKATNDKATKTATPKEQSK